MPIPSRIPPQSEIDELAHRLSNWGRWGVDDQRGTLNHLTETARRRALGLVSDGHSIGLGIPLNTQPSPTNPRPSLHLMLRAGDTATETAGKAEDYLALAYHGWNVTHVDTLAHNFYRGAMYNGVPAARVTSRGALANDISHAADGIIGRGVLLDLPRALGRSWLEPAEAFVPADLELAEARAGVRVEPGDLLLVRTGRWARHAAALACELLPDGEGLFAMAGPDASVLGWLQEREVALIGGEGLNEAFPPDRTPARPPFHVVGIPAMGLCLLNNCDFERLAAACAARRRWEFLLVIAPLNLPGALGSPVNPVAVF